MAKLKIPLLSLGAAGRVGKHLTIRRHKRDHILETRPIPTDAKSSAQLIWRHMYQKAIALWHALSDEEKQEWESLARPKHMTGYAFFMSQALRPNPGLYLPLQGGTMAGDVDMAKHRILRLPLPTDDQEPATKDYVDSLPTNTQGRVEIMPWAYSSIGAGTWAWETDAGGALNGYGTNTSKADLDNISYDIFLDKGTYTLVIFTLKSGDEAILDVDIDGTEVASEDLFTTPASRNYLMTQADISIAAAGRKTLKIRADGKNAGSSAYAIRLHTIALVRTG